MKDDITTYTKRHVKVLDPKEEDLDIHDIAHALTMITRAGGHYSKFYSVAQHSICCALEAVERGYGAKTALACLLHDASEAYLGDMTRPLKKELPAYLEAEERLQSMIFQKFLGEPLTEEEARQVSMVDDAMLFHEFKYYMNEELEVTDRTLVSKPVFVTRSFDQVEDDFIEWFYRLKNL